MRVRNGSNVERNSRQELTRLELFRPTIRPGTKRALTPVGVVNLQRAGVINFGRASTA